MAQCVIPLLLRHLKIPADRITVMDMRDNRDHVASALERGVKYVQERITPDHFQEQLGRHLGAGDILLDLAWNLETTDLLKWCHQKGVNFLNTSVEVWNPYAGSEAAPITELTLYHRHMQVQKMVDGWGSNSGPTAVLDHGANPGLVSHFTKQALIEIASRILAEKPSDERCLELQQSMEDRKFNEIARLTGVKVIHVSERDTQKSSQIRRTDEFVNTWSVEGFYEEGIAPAELGWGTHERRLPAGAQTHLHGPKNQICLDRKGMNTWVRSWCPSGEIRGMVIRHGEAFSISDRLTTYGTNGKVNYRPTVHYAYLPCEDAIRSLDWLRHQQYIKPSCERIMRNDIVSGSDELGCLLMGHDFTSWWIGTQLDIQESRQLVPGQNATTVQVASSVLGALLWMINHPNEGVNLPDDLPHEFVLGIARPYLGTFRSGPTDWSPNVSVLGNVGECHEKATEIEGATNDHWQFGNFLIE